MIKKTLALLLLVLIQFITCACTNSSTSNNVETSDQSTFTCTLDNEQQELVLTYMDGNTVHFSLTDKLLLKGNDSWEYYYVAQGLSWASYEDISAVFIPASIYFSDQNSVLKISQDKGKTWRDIAVPADEHDITGSAFGFTSQDNIWLILEGELAATKACLRFYTSEDGGNTWTYKEIGQPVSGRQLDYINFLSEDEGYLSVGAGIFGPAPLLYKTTDGGETWIECTVETSIKDDYFCIKDIRYNGDIFTMLASLVYGGEVTLTSEDGLTWSQQ